MEDRRMDLWLKGSCGVGSVSFTVSHMAHETREKQDERGLKGTVASKWIYMPKINEYLHFFKNETG